MAATVTAGNIMTNDHNLRGLIFDQTNSSILAEAEIRIAIL